MFDGQPAMHTLGIVIVRLAPGEVELAMLHSPARNADGDAAPRYGFASSGRDPRIARR
jgi:acyl-coenzyme A thioesterase PaaI-like protein